MDKALIKRVLNILKDTGRAYVYTGGDDNCIDENCGVSFNKPHKAKCGYNAVILELEALLED